MTFLNDGNSDLVCERSTSYFNLQSLDKALDLFIEFKFCESDFYFLTGRKNCMVATYNFGSAYIDGVDPEQAALTRAVRSVSVLFAKALKAPL